MSNVIRKDQRKTELFLHCLTLLRDLTKITWLLVKFCALLYSKLVIILLLSVFYDIWYITCIIERQNDVFSQLWSSDIVWQTFPHFYKKAVFSFVVQQSVILLISLLSVPYKALNRTHFILRYLYFCLAIPKE